MSLQITSRKLFRKPAAFTFALLILLGIPSACTQPTSNQPVDPGNIGVIAFCSVQDALANNQADWAMMTADDSEFESALAAVDRLERSYRAAGQALSGVTPASDLHPSAAYVTSTLFELTSIFHGFKRSFIYQDGAAFQAAQANYAETYNKLMTDLQVGAIPGGEAFRLLMGDSFSACAGVVTNVFPASSAYSDSEPENRIVCSNGSSDYSAEGLFSDVASIKWDSENPTGTLEAYSEIGLKMQPLLELSSGPLLNGLALTLSGIVTAYEVGTSTSPEAVALEQALGVMLEGLKQTAASCEELGLNIRQ